VGEAVGADMTEREALLGGALVANAEIRVQAERLIAAYVAPDSDREAIINELITLLMARNSARRRG